MDGIWGQWMIVSKSVVAGMVFVCLEALYVHRMELWQLS